MDTIDARPVMQKRNDNLKKAKLEHGFYSVIDGKKAAAAAEKFRQCARQVALAIS